MADHLYIHLWLRTLMNLASKNLRSGWNDALNVAVVPPPRRQFVPQVERAPKASNQNDYLVILAGAHLESRGDMP